MKAGDKVAIGFFGAIGIGCAIALFFPGTYDLTATRGISGIFHLPMWVLFAIGLTLCVAFIVVVLNNIRRKKSGRPPL